MEIKIPELSLVLLIGVSSSGKSTFAKQHFKETEILSSDNCRAMIADDEVDQTVTKEAFSVLHFIAAKRLAIGKLTVIDATNVQLKARKSLLHLAKEYNVKAVAIVFNLSEQLCQTRRQQRPDRYFGYEIIQRQYNDLQYSLRNLKREGFKQITILNSVTEVEESKVKLVPLTCNMRHVTGPFDIIGDIHGCFDELLILLEKLGYQVQFSNSKYTVTHPQDRKVIFLGDLVDRGPKIPQVLQLVMDMVTAGYAFCVKGNHDMKLLRRLKGHDTKLVHGLAESIQQLQTTSTIFCNQVIDFIGNLSEHYLFDDGKLVVAHAGLPEKLQGRNTGKVFEFALYGKVIGRDEAGLPIRYNWAADYKGSAMVVYGHTPVFESQWINNTICIDTGCVFGGKLTALRYPEKELVTTVAKKIYYKSAKTYLLRRV
ncbi:AAA family ATPase [Candidatus Halobeggiatoa sp. HSG11]|nr:AAA family ATPase [Candidatus Halobeggiatoa sp. HSG11]